MKDNKSNGKRKLSTGAVIAVCAAVVIIIAGAVTAVVLMTRNNYDRIVYDKATGSYISRDSGAAYYAFGLNFEAVAHEKDVAAVLEVSGHEEELYRISGMEKDVWYTTESGEIYSAADEVPEDITGMEVSRVDICRDSVSVSSLAQIYIKSDIEKLTGALTAEGGVTYPGVKSETSYVLRFTLGGEYTGLYYKALYLEYSEDLYDDNDENKSLGKYFLYDRWTKKCVPAGDVVNGYISGS